MLQQPDFRVSGFFWFPGPDFGFQAISGPALGPYFIRVLSPGVQLESKNEGYFFIGVSRVDFEDEILIMKFLFSGRVFNGFCYPPAYWWPVSRIWAEILTSQKEIRISCEKRL